MFWYSENILEDYLLNNFVILFNNFNNWIELKKMYRCTLNFLFKGRKVKVYAKSVIFIKAPLKNWQVIQ